jgi:hypothetical protein
VFLKENPDMAEHIEGQIRAALLPKTGEDPTVEVASKNLDEEMIDLSEV